MIRTQSRVFMLSFDDVAYNKRKEHNSGGRHDNENVNRHRAERLIENASDAHAGVPGKHRNGAVTMMMM